MGYKGYISKHLYSKVKSCTKEDMENKEMTIFLDKQELDFLDFFGISYRKPKDEENPNIYLLNLVDVKKLLFSY